MPRRPPKPPSNPCRNRRPAYILSDVGERGLLQALRRFASTDNPRLLVGFGDDTALWDPREPGQESARPDLARTGREEDRTPLLLATTDTMVEATHFRLDWASWEEVGRKLVASNVSDIASMGGRPTLALVSLACPPSTTVESIEQLYTGIHNECRRWGATLAGGDSVRAPQVVLTLTLLGEKDRDAAPCLRSGLRPGQRIYVTGWPGESGAGLDLLLRKGVQARQAADWKRRLVDRHLLPTPRVEAGLELARRFPDLAMIDVSDGVDNELHLMTAASGMEAAIALGSLPVSPALRKLGNAGKTTPAVEERAGAAEGKHAGSKTACSANARGGVKSAGNRNRMGGGAPSVDPSAFVLFGGEDYELLYATSADLRSVAEALAAADPRLPVHEIGRVIRPRKGGAVVYHDARGNRVDPPATRRFEHFDKERTTRD